jgi:hypothetical protein
MKQPGGSYDKGPQMSFGSYQVNRGYHSDDPLFDPYSPKDDERGNDYFALKNSAIRKDDKKLARTKFSKIQ